MSSTRVVKQIEDMEIDEISLVDRPANQHALVTIAKRRANKENTVPDFFMEDGSPVDEAALEYGDRIFDAEGQEYVVEPEEEVQDERELATAGVSKAFDTPPKVSSSAASILEELSKAVTESDRDQVIAKALAVNEELAKRLSEAEEIAKSERTIRLEREYISKAAEYNVPIAAEELGPVLMRAAENLSYEDCSVLHKALTAAGEMLFEEAGYQGGGDNDDPMSQVEQIISAAVSKSEGSVSRHQATSEFFAQNPAAYDAYRADMKG